MRKIVLFIAALLFMAVPVMAVSNVHINCSDDDVNRVTVSYVSDHNLIRAFGLDITTDTNKITQVVALDPNYRIYPGQIVIVGGDVNDYKTPYDPCDLGDANVTIEMGSLYTMDSNYYDPCDPNNDSGYLMQPDLSGTLLKFYVGGDCNYVIAENAIRGGIVMEDPTEEPNVTLCSGKIKYQPPALDFGDAPDSYVTLLPNGPSHIIGGPRLGANIDAELNGAPSVGANGDDIAGIDDEDGVVFNRLIVNEPANSNVTVTVSNAGGYLNAWIDWGNDGSFATAGDKVVTNLWLGVGAGQVVPITVPAAGVVKNTTLYSRWRITSYDTPTVNYYGAAIDGEVEDHYDPNSAVVCHIPDCVNDVNATAQAKLIANGFTIGTITTACHNTIPAGNVISTDPVFCNYPVCNLAVNMIVSKGHTVPNVVNMTQADANAAIIAAGFVVGTISYGNGGAVPIGSVYSQSPVSGPQPCGTAVNINVSSQCMQPTTTPASIRTDWVTWLKPRCWCYERNCRGDSDGVATFQRWVAAPDLALLKLAYLQTNAVLQGIVLNGVPGICCDFDHVATFQRRVAAPDLATLKTYYLQPTASVPVCVLSPNYYFWCTPPTTCPANF